MAPNTDIHPITLGETLQKGWIALTDQEAAALEPMNRAERRAWQRKNKHRIIKQ